MKVYFLDKLPLKYPGEYESMEFEDYELKRLEDVGAEAVFYWYGAGSYLGAGQILYRRKDGKWYLHDAGHCSCYGPTDEVYEDKPIGNTLDEVLQKCSDELKREVEPLVKLAKSKHYK
ncbi:MAG: hypothetical protein GXO75_15335 [Calditrichaeota bacterium]|nr:hypothetical protein [Calditrichota bacterium]